MAKSRVKNILLELCRVFIVYFKEARFVILRSADFFSPMFAKEQDVEWELHCKNSEKSSIDVGASFRGVGFGRMDSDLSGAQTH